MISLKINYCKSRQVYKLINALRFLENKLQRAVCSRDLAVYFKEFPDLQPQSLMTLSRQLIRAARPRKSPVPRIYPVGQFGKYLYYSATPSPEAKRCFEEYVRQRRIQESLEFDLWMVEFSLLQTPYEAFARNALAGWILEAGRLGVASDQINKARSLALKEFTPLYPIIHVPRPQAAQWITGEIIARTHRFEGTGINVKRHLAFLKWPKSILYQGSFIYPVSSINHYLRAYWPHEDEDAYFHKAILQCLRYGEAFYPKVSSQCRNKTNNPKEKETQ